MHAWAERNGIFDREPWIERSVAVLEHHLHVTPVRRKVALRCADRIAVEQYVAGVGRRDAHDQPGKRRFSAAGFPDNTEGFAIGDFE
jgi:hypothetical protein